MKTGVRLLLLIYDPNKILSFHYRCFYMDNRNYVEKKMVNSFNVMLTHINWLRDGRSDYE
jgi:hypothetical protein